MAIAVGYGYSCGPLGIQVQIVRDFMAAATDTKVRCQVQQMIMGAGKTTVVAPLLALLLADQQTLVMQVKKCKVVFINTAS